MNGSERELSNTARSAWENLRVLAADPAIIADLDGLTIKLLNESMEKLHELVTNLATKHGSNSINNS